MHYLSAPEYKIMPAFPDGVKCKSAKISFPLSELYFSVYLKYSYINQA